MSNEVPSSVRAEFVASLPVGLITKVHELPKPKPKRVGVRSLYYRQKMKRPAPRRYAKSVSHK